MDLQDETECPNQITTGMVANCSPGNVSAAFETTAIQPKVRKPYTISKQRERWTDEEHQKFLEALKLYGRAWRQIEEHVGTKTAVQIRSHAQKFFSKVVRDSSGCAEGSLKPTEIPPPRPKKRPIHPYPRKMADSLPTKKTVPPQQEHSPLPNQSIGEIDNLSPTSVLSNVGSDTLGSAASELHSSCLSPPGSCITGTSLLSAKDENGCNISYSSAEEVKASASSLRVNAAPSIDDKSTLKLESLSNTTSSLKETAAVETPSMSIKLFGKTVLVKDSQSLSYPHADGYMPLPSETSQENFEKGENPFEALSMNHIQSKLSTQMVYQWPFGGPLPPKEFLKVDVEAAIPDNMPWLALYQGLLFPYLQSYSRTKVGSSLDETVIEDKVRRERCCSSSNTGSISEVDNGHNNFAAIESRHQQANVERIGYAKGFVPYKRCLADRDVNSSMIVQEEREGQRARVCS